MKQYPKDNRDLSIPSSLSSPLSTILDYSLATERVEEEMPLYSHLPKEAFQKLTAKELHNSYYS